MPQDYDKKLFRLVKLLNLLQENGRVNTLELADEFNISRRTAQRDILRLSAAGFPVEEPEKGVYSFSEGYSLRKLPLSEKEASLLVFTCEIARQLGHGFESAYQNIFAKMLSGGQWETPLHLMAIKPAKGQKKQPFFDCLQAAVEAKCQILLDYNRPDGKRKSYTLEPLKLVYYEGYWYLVSRPAGQKWILKHRLDRIKRAETLAKTFSPPKNLEKMLRESSSIWFNEKRDKKVLLRISSGAADYFTQRQCLPAVTVKKRYKNGDILLQTTVCQYMEVIPTIYRWIPEIKVLSPRVLAQTLRRNLAAYLKNCR